jgi:hypothetical protein
LLARQIAGTAAVLGLVTTLFALSKTSGENARQMHCSENLKQIFPEMKLRGLPVFHIQVSVSDLYIATIGPQTQCSKIDAPIVGICKSFTDT